MFSKSASVALKIVHEGSIRRLQVKGEITVDAIRTAFSSVYEGRVVTALKYEDDEGDMVVFDADEEVAEALSIVRKQGKTSFKVYVYARPSTVEERMLVASPTKTAPDEEEEKHDEEDQVEPGTQPVAAVAPDSEYEFVEVEASAEAQVVDDPVKEVDDPVAEEVLGVPVDAPEVAVQVQAVPINLVQAVPVEAVEAIAVKAPPVKEETPPRVAPVLEPVPAEEKPVEPLTKDGAAELLAELLKDPSLSADIETFILHILNDEDVFGKGVSSDKFELLVTTALSACPTLMAHPSVQVLLPCLQWGGVKSGLQHKLHKLRMKIGADPIAIIGLRGRVKDFVPVFQTELQHRVTEKAMLHMKEGMGWRWRPDRWLMSMPVHLIAIKKAFWSAVCIMQAEKSVNGPSEVVHRGISCDDCGMMPIVGARFKCTVWHDYDLCSDCEAKGKHLHAMIKMRQPVAGWQRRRWGQWGRGGQGRCGRGNRHGQGRQPANPVSQPHQLAFTYRCDVNLPDKSEVLPSSVVNKQWAIRSDSGWGEGVKLAFVRGDQLAVEDKVPVPAAAKGQEVVLSTHLRMPACAGRFSSSFRLEDEQGQRFGPRLWVDLLCLPEKQVLPLQPARQPDLMVVRPMDNLSERFLPNVPVAQVVPGPVVPGGAPVDASAPVAVAQPVAAEPVIPDDLAAKCAVLEGMGFVDRSLNLFLLKENKGDVRRAAEYLLENCQ